MKGKVALITGSSKGIGRAIALAFAARGADVIVNYNSSEEAAVKVVEDIKSKGVESIAIKANVGDRKQVEDMLAIIKEKFGRLDILVNNAGITRDRTLKKMSDEEWDTVISTNLTSVFNCTRAVLPIMPEGSRILNISSVSGITGNFGQTNYSAAKAGIIGLTKSLAKELGKKKITVNAIAPGFTDTEMTRDLPLKQKIMVKMLIPLGEFGKVEDIANAAVFFCSDEARYITGQVLRVDGGLSF